RPCGWSEVPPSAFQAPVLRQAPVPSLPWVSTGGPAPEALEDAAIQRGEGAAGGHGRVVLRPAPDRRRERLDQRGLWRGLVGVHDRADAVAVSSSSILAGRGQGREPEASATATAALRGMR